MIYLVWIIVLIHGANTGWGKTYLNLEFSLWMQFRHVYKTLPARCVFIAEECKCNWQQSCEYFLSFDTIFIYIDRDFNINNCIPKMDNGYHENGLLLKKKICVLQNACALHVWYLIAVDLTLWTIDFWGFTIVHRVYLYLRLMKAFIIYFAKRCWKKWRNNIT